MEIVGPIDLVARRIPLIEVDATEVDNPHQRRAILNHRKRNDAFRSVIDPADLDPRRPWLRRALHEEEVARGPMRVPLHHHRAVADVRQQHGGDIGVVLEEIAFRQTELGPEDLAEIREPDLLALDGCDDVVLIAGDDQTGTGTHVGRAFQARHRGAESPALRSVLSGGSFGGRAPCRTAPITGMYSSSTPSLA